MKSIAVFLLAVLALVSLPMSTLAKGVRLGDEFMMRIGQVVKVNGTHLRIEFVDVVEDSRCPSDVECGWAGNAALNLELKWKGRQPNSVLVNTTSGPAQAEFRRFIVKLIRLEPNRVTGQTIDKADYVATLMVIEDINPDEE